MSPSRQVTTAEFLEAHPVFSLDEAAGVLQPPGGRSGAVERLKYHLGTGRLVRVTREVYASVPAGVDSEVFRPDPFLVAATVRPDAVFSHHGALQLLGAAHSSWNLSTLYTATRRSPLSLDGEQIQFLEHPAPVRSEALLGTQRVEHHGRLLRATGPERTLVEGFHRPDLAGGPEELVTSASGLPVLDLDLLAEILNRYDTRKLWAAVGWFLEVYQGTFHVPDEMLAKMERHRPRSPQYLLRASRGGRLSNRWNLILPAPLAAGGEPDEG